MSDQHLGAPAQPPPAWYPDPASPQHVRWWDGASWTGYVNGAQPPRPGLGRGWFTLARWTQVALGLCVVLGVVQIGAMWWARGKSVDWQNRPQDYDVAVADTMDTWDVATSVAPLLGTILVGILFICWLYQAAASDRVAPHELRWKPGWAIGGWFVPFLSLAVPLLVVNDVRRAALRRRGDAESAGGRLVGWWWASWLALTATNLADVIAMPSTEADITWEGLELYYALSALIGLNFAVAAVLAILVVGRITASMRARPTGFIA